ncbi:universal stress protein [Adhaeribacter swui]|uniref:Universal stress protein n=1 Tax=Adhaeribacter swui TaxID=2086471 RepID=A0A7G7G9F4_9BACT|nr:universal stress protein [Adhaeribacter swui]QNF33788.1 universal stress protein [Adhaeribacter swui]
MKTFLVPTDFSKNATNALNYAASLTSQLNGKLLIVHVVNFVILPVRSGKLVSLTEKTDIHYYAQLNKIADKLRQKKNIDCEVAVIDQSKHGSFQAGLNQFILEHGIDLVIMGTKGATNFLDKMVGTNTSEFIKEAVCPVLVIPVDARFTTIKHLAYLTTPEKEEDTYLQKLFGFNQSFSSPVFISVITTGPPQNGEEEANLHHVFKEFSISDYRLVQIAEEDIVTGIQTFVKDNQVDLVAVSVPKQDFFENLFQSNIGKELVYQPTLPLLAMPQ